MSPIARVDDDFRRAVHLRFPPVSAVDRYIERIRRVPPVAFDAAMAVAILGLDIIELAISRDPGTPFPPLWAILLFAVPCLGLVARRRNVLIPYALLEGISFLPWHVLVGAGFVSTVILSTVVVYSVADRAPGWAAALVAMNFVGNIWLGDVLYGGAPPVRHLLEIAIYWTPVYVLPGFAGWSQQRRRKLTAQLEVRVDDVRREQQRLAEQAVARERIQIAHELRALVSQGVEQMTGQARTARGHLAARPAETQDGIAVIELTGRRTLVEMRRLLLVLRRNSPEDPGPTSVLRAVDEESGERTAAEIAEGMQRNLSRLRPWLRRPWVVDWSLVLMLSGFMAGEFSGYGPAGGTIVAGWLPRVLAAAILGALLIRRTLPFSVLCVVSVAVFLWIINKGDIPGATEQALLWATFTVAAYKKPGWAAAGAAVAILSWGPILARQHCVCLFHIGAFATFAMVAGIAHRAGWRLNRELQRLTDSLVRTRNERVRLAVVEERTRVAREMHDLVAHSVTAMVVQAGAARMLAETDRAMAEEHLKEIEQAGADAMRELGLLSATLDPGSTAVEQERSDVASDVRLLVERFRRMGQPVELVEEGDPPPIDQGLHISVYRIVQEALTNVQKHARGAPAMVRIRYQLDGIEAEVTNPAPSTMEADALPGAGQGLVGIRERASLFGGTTEAGPTPDGGFRIYAHLAAELVPA